MDGEIKYATYMTAAIACRISIEEIIRLLRTDPVHGLPPSEVTRRLRMYGKNQPGEDTELPLWLKYVSQFEQPMIILLLISAVVSLLFGQYDDAVSITVAVLIVVTVGFVQEHRSEQALVALSNLLPPQAKCFRTGWSGTTLIPACDLVPGDIIKLESGDRVPADARFLESHDIMVDESTFTGESEPVSKFAVYDVSSHLQVHSERSMVAYAGSMIKQGHGRAVIVATGDYSEFGAVLKLMRAERAPDTPLRASMDKLSRQLSIISLVVISIIVLFGFFFGGFPFREILSIGVSLAVAAIPEGLPIVVTVTLALGVLRMAKQNTIVKRLSAVETMGRLTTVCFDKTGTLTHNRMSIRKVLYTTSMQSWSFNAGDDRLNGFLNRSFCHILEDAILCNNARPTQEHIASPFGASGQGFRVVGQPTETAFWSLAHDCFSNPTCYGYGRVLGAHVSFKRVNEWPFNADRRWMAVLVENVSNLQRKVIMKGAPEAVFEHCKNISADIVDESRRMCSDGSRVLAIAEGAEVPVNAEIRDLQLVGLVAMFDPIRDEASSCVASLKEHGIRVVLITGDALYTAQSIARNAGLDINQLLSGDEAETLIRQNQLLGALSTCSVFYRTDPKQKLMVIKAIQSERNQVIAMVGDGVNDAIALRASDVGISMGGGLGKSGLSEATDVSREASDVILLDDSLMSIVKAVEEGKSIFSNIQNFVRFQLSTSVSAMALIAFGTFITKAGHSPLNAMQILWINIIMDGPPAQSLGVEPATRDGLTHLSTISDCETNNSHNDDADSKEIITKQLMADVAINAVIIVVGTLFVFAVTGARSSNQTDPAAHRRQTTMTFTCFVLFDMFNALSCRSKHQSVFEIGLLSNRSFVVAISMSLIGQALVIYSKPLQRVFQTEPISFTDIIFLVVISSTIFIVSEIRKMSRVFYTRMAKFRHRRVTSSTSENHKSFQVNV